MGIGPVYAIPRLLELTKLTIDDVDLFEVNLFFREDSHNILQIIPSQR